MTEHEWEGIVYNLEKQIDEKDAEIAALRKTLEWIKEVAFNLSCSHLHVAGDIYEVAKAALGQKETHIIPNYDPVIMDRECKTNSTMEET